MGEEDILGMFVRWWNISEGCCPTFKEYDHAANKFRTCGLNAVQQLNKECGPDVTLVLRDKC